MNKKPDHDKTVLVIIVLNLTQIAMIAAVLLYLTEARVDPGLLASPWILGLLFVTVAAIVINSLAAFRNKANLLRAGQEFGLLADTLSKLEKLNSTLRGQRHDFMNHLQVVYSLIEMEEYKPAAEYIEKVYGDIQKVSRVMKTSNAAVNALLQAKLLTCEKNGISAELTVMTQMKDLIIPSWEFCRVIGNLIDNAIYALLDRKGETVEPCETSERLIKIELSEDLKYYYLRVSDNGSPIPARLKEKIFEPGFTTKGDKGEGVGLAVSRDIIEGCGGYITLLENTALTVFEVKIPRADPGTAVNSQNNETGG